MTDYYVTATGSGTRDNFAIDSIERSNLADRLIAIHNAIGNYGSFIQGWNDQDSSIAIGMFKLLAPIGYYDNGSDDTTIRYRVGLGTDPYAGQFKQLNIALGKLRVVCSPYDLPKFQAFSLAKGTKLDNTTIKTRMDARRDTIKSYVLDNWELVQSLYKANPAKAAKLWTAKNPTSADAELAKFIYDKLNYQVSNDGLFEGL